MMSFTFSDLANAVLDGTIYIVNGLLIIAYWLAGNLAALISTACALLLAVTLDAEVQERAGHRPRRHERGSAMPLPRTAQALTLIVLLLWLAASWGMAAPAPVVGAAMWIVGMAALFAMPAQRFGLLWGVKAGIAIYSLAVLGSRLYLAYTAGLTAEQWAALVGSTADAQAIVSSTRSSVTTIILWALWLVLPLGYFSLIIQQVFVNPMAIVNPFAGAQDVIRNLRTRGEG